MSSVISFSAAAYDQDGCSIYLCLPMGFVPSGCGGAFKSFKHRIEHFQSPMPSWGSCQSHDDPSPSNMKVEKGFAAYIPKGERCVSWEHGHTPDGSTYRRCVQKMTFRNDQYIKNEVCHNIRSGNKEDYTITTQPIGCTLTKKYINEIMDGKGVGKPYYY